MNPQIATRILSLRTRVSPPAEQPQRWTETPLRNAADVAQIIIDLLPRPMVQEIAARLGNHLSATNDQ